MCGPYFNRAAVRELAKQADGFHIHIYWDAQQSQKDIAQGLAKDLIAAFPAEVEGKISTVGKVGPHLQNNFAVHVKPEKIEEIIDWLNWSSYGYGLSVLVHPETGDALKDHDELALWVGEPVALNLDFFRQKQKPKGPQL